MATLNATTSSDILIPTNNGVTYRGLAGDDTYILSNAITANASISIVDTSGNNKIQLVDGLSIASTKFAADAVQLTLSNGAVVTINGADKFSFDVGGNATSGTIGAVNTFAEFASALGVSSLPTGTTLVDGSADISVSGTSIGAAGASVSYTITTDATTVAEGSAITVTVTPSAAPTSDQNVTVSVSGNDNGGALVASEIGDFEVSTGSLTFPAGSSDAQTFTVTASNDTVSEPLEGLKVSLLDDSLNVLGTKILGISDNSATAPQTFTLSSTTNTVTGGVDNVTGAGGDDTFNATIAASLTSADIVDGKGGTDTLNARYSVGADSTQTATVSNVERIFVDTDEGLANTAHTTTFDLSTFTGVTEAWASNNDSSATSDILNITNIPLGTTVGVKGGDANSNNTFTFLFTTALTDTATLALDTAKSNLITIAGIEAITVSASGKSTIDELATTSALTLNVNATGKTVLTNIDDATRVVDASGSTGAVTIGGVGTYSKGLTITGGSGNDTIKMGTTLDKLDTIVGGEGIDTLLTSADANTAGMGAGVSGFEVFGLSTTDANDTMRMDTIDVSEFYLVNADSNDNGTAFTTTFTKADNGDNITIYAASDDSDDNAEGTLLTVTHAVDSSSDDISVTLAGIGASAYTSGGDALGSGIDTVTLSNAETVNIVSNASATNAAITKNSIDLLVPTVGKAINISGTTNLRITDIGSTPSTLLSIDASALDAKLELYGVDATGTALGGNTIKLAGKNSTLSMTGLNVYDTIVGGAGTADYAVVTAVGGLTTATGALNVSDVETLALLTTTANTITLTNVTGLNTLELAHEANDTNAQKILGLDPATTVQIGVNNDDTFGTDAVYLGGGTLTLSLADETGADDTLKVSVFSGADTTNVALKTTAIENLDLAISAVKAGDSTVSVAAALINSLTISGGDLGSATDVLTLGTAYKTLKTVSSTWLGDINISLANYASTDGVTGVTLSSIGPLTANYSVTLSSYNDTVTIGKTSTTAGPTITAGAGTADTLNMTVGAGFRDLDDITGFETINMAITAGDSITIGANADELDGIVGAKSLVITGGNAVSTLTLGSTNDKLTGTTLLNVDASAFAGKLVATYDAEALGNALRAQAIKGSETNAFDVVIGTYDSASTASAADKINTQYVETVKVTVDSGNDGSETYHLDVLKSDATIQLNTGTSGATINVLNVSVNDGSQVFEFGGTATDGVANASNVSFSLTSTIATDTALTIQLTDTDTNGTTTDIDAAGVEDITIKLKANGETHSIDLAGVAPTTGATGSVTLTGGLGTGGVTITALAAATNTINASAAIDALTLAATARPGTAMTITGSAVNDSLAMENTADVMDGSGGTSDTLVISYTGIIGGVVVDLSADDQVTDMDGSGNTAIQKNFENVDVSSYANFGAIITGTAKANTITGSSQNDNITGGNGADVIDGKGGTDIISFTETVAAVDTLTVTVASATTVTGFTLDSDILDGDASAASGNGTPANTIKQAAALTDGDDKTAIGTNAIVVMAVDDTSVAALDAALDAANFDATTMSRWFLIDTTAGVKLVKATNDDTDDDNDVTVTTYATFTDITDLTANSLTSTSAIDFV